MRFRDEFRRVVPAGLELPEALGMLFDWVEDQGLVVEREGTRVGTLFPRDRMIASWTETSREGGTDIEFEARGDRDLQLWFGTDDRRVLDRVGVFARTGADGSTAALWRDDDGRSRIVHLGSGSGSTLTCVLAEEPVDFLRLLAIGYDEICWDEAYGRPPNAEGAELRVEPNEVYREWVRSTFGVVIAETASEIVRHPDGMDDAAPVDAFARWMQSVRR